MTSFTPVQTERNCRLHDKFDRKICKFTLERVPNTVRKVKCWSITFSPIPTMFPTAFLKGLLKLWIKWKRVKVYIRHTL